jgi:diguanylate cyclase (GGDEF)-like protein
MTNPERRVVLLFDRYRQARTTPVAFGPRAQRALVRWAFKDDLTGLLNRRGFRILARRRMTTARRQGRAILLFFADLDSFKRINDTFGHLEGDRALMRTAACFRATFRRTDVLARFGGDEFVALVAEEPECSAAALCGRLRENLAHTAAGHRYRLSLSVGVARFGPERTISLEDLFKAADARLYRDKQHGHALAGLRARRPAPR